jgi:salicylate hydroxylase
MKAPSVAIVGGGLAGLAAAAALTHFGLEAEIFESAPSLGEIGAGINVSPQAIRLLRAIGLDDRIMPAANVAPGVLTRDMYSGAPLDYRDQTAVAARFGAPLCTFHRADLLEALAQGIDRSRLHLDHRLIGLTEQRSNVELSFANGVRHGAELVIAADGIHSLVRRALYGGDNPTYTGQMVWRAMLPGADVPAEVFEPSGHVQWLGSGRHFFAYYLRGRDVVNIVTQEDTDQWVGEGWSTPGDPDEMRRSFPNPEPGFAAVLNAVTQCSKWGLFLRPPTENWGRDRIQLIGDAAHAMLPNAGQGAAQAFEDAYILGRWLGAMPGNPAAALENFRRIRIRRVHSVQRYSSNIVRTKHDYVPQAKNAAHAKVDAVDAMAWIWGYDAVSAWDREPAAPAVV